MIQQEGKNWTEVVARKLRESEAPVSDEGWSRLERELFASSSRADEDEHLARVRKKNWILRYTAAAAAILVCVSIGVRVLRIDHNVMEKGVVSVSETTVGGPHGGTDHATSGAVPSSHQSLADGLAARVREQLALPVSTTEQASQPQVEEVAALRSDSEIANPFNSDAASLSNSEEATPLASEAASRSDFEVAPRQTQQPLSSETYSRSEGAEERFGNESLAAEYEQLFADAEPVARKRGAVSLFASGGWSGGASSQGGASGASQFKALPMTTSQAVALHEGYESYSFDHRQPLSFGLNYRHEFKYGLSLETGLNYTLLRSNVALPGSDSRLHQQLHLLGVPVRMNWQFLQAGRFSMYVGAGGMVERCVSARFGNERISEPAWLWSVAAALGAQYDLGRHVGIYFEPALSHYLTKTSLQTIYTESPIVLDLRLGLRFTY